MLSKIHIAVEGAVAVGKSTLLPKLHEVFLAKGMDIDLVLELVDKWVNSGRDKITSPGICLKIRKNTENMHRDSKWQPLFQKYSP